MFQKYFLYCVLVTIISVESEDDENYHKIYEKHGFSYRVHTQFYPEKKFFLEGDLNHQSPLVIRQGSIVDINEMTQLEIANIKELEIYRGAFKNLPNLKSLVLYRTNLNKVEAGLFNNLNVTYLDLGENQISTIASDAFDNMTHLETIRFNYNKLNNWNPNWFANTSITEAYVSHNLIEEIPANAFKNFRGDKEATLFFYNNKIKDISDDAFKGLKRIKILQLGKNNIEILNGNFLRNIEIGELRLDDNKIHCLADEDLNKIFVANSTSLKENPWNSDCLEKIKEWAKKHHKTVIAD